MRAGPRVQNSARQREAERREDREPAGSPVTANGSSQPKVLASTRKAWPIQ